MPPASLDVRSASAGIDGTVIVRDVTFHLSAGKRLALVGPNGAGKTTVLRMLAGLAKPLAGSVHVGETDINSMPARMRARAIAFVGQNELPPDELLVGEMVALGRIPHRPSWAVGSTEDMAVVRDSLARVGLAEYIDRPCSAMSGGEQRRALLARGLAQNCPVLLLDEPTNHLDILWQIDILERIAEIDSTVIASMHDLDLVLRHFDYAAVISEGTLKAFGAPQEILEDELVAQAFGVRAHRISHPLNGQQHLLLGPRAQHM